MIFTCNHTWCCEKHESNNISDRELLYVLTHFINSLQEQQQQRFTTTTATLLFASEYWLDPRFITWVPVIAHEIETNTKVRSLKVAVAWCQCSGHAEINNSGNKSRWISIDQRSAQYRKKVRVTIKIKSNCSIFKAEFWLGNWKSPKLKATRKRRAEPSQSPSYLATSNCPVQKRDS